MTSTVGDGRAASSMLGAFLVLVAVAGLMYGITAAADEYQQQKDQATYYRETTDELLKTQRELRKQVAELKAQQQALVEYFEGEGEVVPSDLGGTGPPPTVIRERRSTESSGGSSERRVIRRDTRVMPSQPSSSAPDRGRRSEPPSVRVPDLPVIPKVPEVKVPEVADLPREVLKGTPLDGVL